MRIGIDIDNTMCGTDEIIDTKIEEYIKEKKMTRKEFFSDSKYMEDFYAVKIESIVREDPLKDDFLDVLNKLKVNNEIIIVTARTEHFVKRFKHMREATKEWLEKNNIYYLMSFISK